MSHNMSVKRSLRADKPVHHSSPKSLISFLFPCGQKITNTPNCDFRCHKIDGKTQCYINLLVSTP